MKMKSQMVCPIKKDGKWMTIVKTFEEDVPDLGRNSIFCNKCGMSNYPECQTQCPIGREITFK